MKGLSRVASQLEQFRSDHPKVPIHEEAGRTLFQWMDNGSLTPDAGFFIKIVFDPETETPNFAKLAELTRDALVAKR